MWTGEWNCAAWFSREVLGVGPVCDLFLLRELDHGLQIWYDSQGLFLIETTLDASNQATDGRQGSQKNPLVRRRVCLQCAINPTEAHDQHVESRSVLYVEPLGTDRFQPLNLFDPKTFDSEIFLVVKPLSNLGRQIPPALLKFDEKLNLLGMLRLDKFTDAREFSISSDVGWLSWGWFPDKKFNLTRARFDRRYMQLGEPETLIVENDHSHATWIISNEGRVWIHSGNRMGCWHPSSRREGPLVSLDSNARARREFETFDLGKVGTHLHYAIKENWLTVCWYDFASKEIHLQRLDPQQQVVQTSRKNSSKMHRSGGEAFACPYGTALESVLPEVPRFPVAFVTPRSVTWSRDGRRLLYSPGWATYPSVWTLELELPNKSLRNWCCHKISLAGSEANISSGDSEVDRILAAYTKIPFDFFGKDISDDTVPLSNSCQPSSTNE
jgi:hypothetical protein